MDNVRLEQRRQDEEARQKALQQQNERAAAERREDDEPPAPLPHKTSTSHTRARSTREREGNLNHRSDLFGLPPTAPAASPTTSPLPWEQQVHPPQSSGTSFRSTRHPQAAANPQMAACNRSGLVQQQQQQQPPMGDMLRLGRQNCGKKNQLERKIQIEIKLTNGLNNIMVYIGLYMIIISIRNCQFTKAGMLFTDVISTDRRLRPWINGESFFMPFQSRKLERAILSIFVYLHLLVFALYLR